MQKTEEPTKGVMLRAPAGVINKLRVVYARSYARHQLTFNKWLVARLAETLERKVTA